MADIFSLLPDKFIKKPIDPAYYSIDITSLPLDIEFTITGVKTDAPSKLKIADELERIARIIRTDTVVENATI